MTKRVSRPAADQAGSRSSNIKNHPFSTLSLSIVVTLLLCISGGALLTGGIALMDFNLVPVGISFVSLAGILIISSIVVVIMGLSGAWRKLNIHSDRTDTLSETPSQSLDEYYEPQTTPDDTPRSRSPEDMDTNHMSPVLTPRPFHKFSELPV